MPPDYFEELYRANADPWDFAESPYEREKYARTLAALPRRRYRHALEIGCSIGVFTALLRQHAERITAIDASRTALAHARARCHGLDGITFAEMVVPRQWPVGTFDLLVLSEVLYYLDPDDLVRLAACAQGVLATDGDLLLVHWTGPTNYPLTGDAAAELFIDAMRPERPVRHQERHPEYRLDVLTRRPTVS